MSIVTAPPEDTDGLPEPANDPAAGGGSGQGSETDRQRGRAHLDATLAAWIAVVALVVGLIGSPPWNSTSSELPAGVVARFESGVLERADAGSWIDMEPGDLVYPETELRSSDGAVLEIRVGRIELAPESRVRADRTLRLESGGVLVENRDEEQGVEIGPVLATGRGLWRVDAQSLRRIAVYEGEVRAGPADQQGLEVGALAQADLAGGQLPERALPLRYDASDAWDGRLLEHVIAIDRQAAGLRRSLDVRFGTEDRPAGFYANVADLDTELRAVLQTVDLSPDEGFGPSPEVLLAITAVRAIRDGTGMSAAEAADNVVSLRRDGATWGITLGRHGLRAEAFRVTFNETLSSQALGPATPAGPSDEETPDAAAASGEEPETPTTASPQPGAPPGDSDEAPDEQPQAPPGDDPQDLCEVEPCEEVNDTVDDLTDLIDEVVPGSPVPAVDSAEEAAGEILPPHSSVGQEPGSVESPLD